MTDKMYNDAQIAELYDLCNTWGDDNDFYLSLATSGEKLKILDLGCGTGILSHAFAEKGHTVVGCDPAPAMLEIARKNDKNKKVEWVLSGAQEYKSTTTVLNNDKILQQNNKEWKNIEPRSSGFVIQKLYHPHSSLWSLEINIVESF